MKSGKMEIIKRKEKNHPGNGIKIPKVGRIGQTVHSLRFERFTVKTSLNPRPYPPPLGCRKAGTFKRLRTC